jgi:hypothetical protein
MEPPANYDNRQRHPAGLGRRLTVTTLFAVALITALLVPGRRWTVEATNTTMPVPAKPGASAPAATTYGGFRFAPAPAKLSAPDLKRENDACIGCHAMNEATSDFLNLHKSKAAVISCVGCHGGNTDHAVPKSIQPGTPSYNALKEQAHGIKPKYPELWKDGANPKAAGALVLQESPDWIRFVNPGDLRAAAAACGACHNPDPAQGAIVDHVRNSMMTHGAMLWGAALYNNGVIDRKNPIYGEAYSIDGQPRQLYPTTVPDNPQPNNNSRPAIKTTWRELLDRGWLPTLFPLPRWEITQPGNILRVFERGGEIRPIIGIPDPEEDPGRPDVKLSNRGLGTDVRTDPVFLGLQKTRLMDPTLNLFGTNDHPGDYRGSGCTACHVVFANDRDPEHSSVWSRFGNRGESFSSDRTINPRGPTSAPSADIVDASMENLGGPPAEARQSGHPIHHVLVKDPPSQTCIVCHMHPGTNVVNAFFGDQWWDNETDGQFMYPRSQKHPTPDQEAKVSLSNPEGAAPRGLWSDLYPDDVSHAGIKAGPDFLENVVRLNPLLKQMQFEDFHGHGWVFRKVFRQDRAGTLLDRDGKPISADDPHKFDMAVHLKDIHLERGMHCVDCHFTEDTHGNGNLYGETRNAITVQCEDCHGTLDHRAKLLDYLDPDKQDQKDATLPGVFSGAAVPRRSDADYDRVIKQIDKTIGEHFDVDTSGDKPALLQKSAIFQQADKLKMTAPADKLVQQWTVPQASDSVDAPDFVPQDLKDRKNAGPADKSIDEQITLRRARARYAHTVRRRFDNNGNPYWADNLPAGENASALPFAHSNEAMSCYACHTSWNTSCFGCHLPMRANQFKPMLHNEGQITRNFTNYSFQTLRDDIYMLGVDSTVKQHKIVPVRSACAVLVSSQNADREWIYIQQQTVSAEGYAGTAFSPYFPHTVRSAETKQCTDCHLSRSGDNNAIMAQLLMQGTNAVNFIGRFAWVAAGAGGLRAVAVTERDEPQAVIGSPLHHLAYPDDFEKHLSRGLELDENYEHAGNVLDVQVRGEYAYAACGGEGFVAYDIANIDDKGFSERIITAPVSPLGQRFYVKTRYATSVCSPSTMAIDPTRSAYTVNLRSSAGSTVTIEPNQEGVITAPGQTKAIEPKATIPPLYAYLYVTDRDEGLVVIGSPPGTGRGGVSTLLDGDPENNFLDREATFNPKGVLNGARSMALCGSTAYICCNAGIVLVDLADPRHPQYIRTISNGLREPRKIAVQFRYAFVADADGLKVLNITRPDNPRLIADATVPMSDARDIYVCRTYGYVAAGAQGLAIIDLTRPERPQLVQTYNAAGLMDDATAVRVGMTNTSLFAYVADGVNGLKVVLLTGPEDTPGFLGFSPRPTPRLIARFEMPGRAVAISKGLDRDRAVDEDGNQLAVFGRRGARPMDLKEQQMLYLRSDKVDAAGEPVPYTVTDDPPNASVTGSSSPRK